MTAIDLDGPRDASRRDGRPILRFGGSRGEGPWYGDAVPPTVAARLPARAPGLAFAVWVVALLAIVCL